MAKEAESLGYGASFRSDHYLGMGTEGLPGRTDARVTLAGPELARYADEVKLPFLDLADLDHQRLVPREVMPHVRE